ncbi:Complex I assembly factor ACAD9, mitochondrial [Halotydeus destructor]|nr:Complex I assembly factor ACAD9, mitochondrial [Halotydeus destructor]
MINCKAFLTFSRLTVSRNKLRQISGFLSTRTLSSQNTSSENVRKQSDNDEDKEKSGAGEKKSNENEQQTNQHGEEKKDYIPYSELVEAERLHHYKEYDLPAINQPEPLRNLKLSDKIQKVYKEGSFVRNLFLGEYDKDFLSYPEILRSRHQFLELVKQQTTINKYFKGLVMRNPKDNFRGFGFDSLWFLTKTEMINVIESVGHAMSVKPENMKYNVDKSPIDYFNRPSCHPIFEAATQQTILSLIMCNTAVGTINSTDNMELKRRIYSDLNQKPNLKVAFAWSEDLDKFSVNPCLDWKTHAQVTNDKKYWVVSGSKSNIINEDYDFYLVFARTSDYPDDSGIEKPEQPGFLLEQTTPYEGMVTILVPKEQIAVTEVYTENGVSYQRIEIQDIMLSREQFEVIPAQVDGVRAANFKGLGQLGLSAYILGQMKTSMEQVYLHLLTEKVALLSCELIGELLARMTHQVYALESTLYMAAAMFDSFETKANPEVHLEASIVKILAVEYGREFNKTLQQIYGTKMVTTSPLDDMLCIIDNLIESSMRSRLLIGYQGMEYVAEKKSRLVSRLKKGAYANPLKSNFSLKFKKSMVDSQRLVMDLQGYLHPGLQTPAEALERITRRLEYATEVTLGRWGSLQANRQSDLDRLATFAIEVFKLTAVTARASRSHTETLRNSDIDCNLAILMSEESLRMSKMVLDEVETVDVLKIDVFNKVIFDRMSERGGYFLQHPVDSFTKHPPEELILEIRNRNYD